MNSYGLFTEIKESVYSQVSLKEIDDLIKKNIGGKEVYSKLLSAVGSSTLKYLKKLNNAELDALKHFVTFSIAENSKNAMNATLFEDGYIAADAMVEMEIGKIIQNYSPTIEGYMSSDKKKDSKQDPSENEMGN